MLYCFRKEENSLYKVITYKSRTGNDEITQYIQWLNDKMISNKDARIRYKKIMEYIGQLQAYGVAAGEPAMKHLSGTELWELRPTNDKILFAYWKDDVFILLHYFAKKTRKTPPQEINQAKRNLKDFLERYGD